MLIQGVGAERSGPFFRYVGKLFQQPLSPFFGARHKLRNCETLRRSAEFRGLQPVFRRMQIKLYQQNSGIVRSATSTIRELGFIEVRKVGVGTKDKITYTRTIGNDAKRSKSGRRLLRQSDRVCRPR